MPGHQSDETTEYYFKQYLETQKITMEKIGNGIEALSKNQVEHDQYARENFTKNCEQHKTMIDKLAEYYKIILLLIGIVTALVGVKILQGGGI